MVKVTLLITRVKLELVSTLLLILIKVITKGFWRQIKFTSWDSLRESTEISTLVSLRMKKLMVMVSITNMDWTNHFMKDTGRTTSTTEWAFTNLWLILTLVNSSLARDQVEESLSRKISRFKGTLWMIILKVGFLFLIKWRTKHSNSTMDSGWITSIMDSEYLYSAKSKHLQLKRGS